MVQENQQRPPPTSAAAAPVVSEENAALTAPRVVDTLNDFAQQYDNHKHMSARLGGIPWQDCAQCREVAGYAIEAIERALTERTPAGHVLIPITVSGNPYGPGGSGLVPVAVTETETATFMAQAAQRLLNGDGAV